MDRFLTKQHETWRNIGSKSANLIAEWLTEKPRGLYMSTFRCMNRFLMSTEILKYNGPYPFVDGLVFQITDRIGSVEVTHLPNKTGRRNYTLGRLVRLWLTIFINFSTRPLQLSISLGLVMAAMGGLGCDLRHRRLFPGTVGVQRLAVTGGTYAGITGTQLIILGLMGEYIGRMFIHIGGRPQAIIRSVRFRHCLRAMFLLSNPRTSVPQPTDLDIGLEGGGGGVLESGIGGAGLQERAGE